MRFITITTMFVALLVGSAQAHAHENEEKILAIKTVEINGTEIQLSMTQENGKICKQVIETIQRLAYGETAYTIGKECKSFAPSLEEA